ncbi:TPA: hypothetical protein ACH3X1_015270 [Trebouxia sp. C0004]
MLLHACLVYSLLAYTGPIVVNAVARQNHDQLWFIVMLANLTYANTQVKKQQALSARCLKHMCPSQQKTSYNTSLAVSGASQSDSPHLLTFHPSLKKQLCCTGCSNVCKGAVSQELYH